MKKATITLSYDEEKLSALKLYLGQKETQIEDELVKALDTLYTKSVPAGVREFLEMRIDGVSKPPMSRPVAPCGDFTAGVERENTEIVKTGKFAPCAKVGEGGESDGNADRTRVLRIFLENPNAALSPEPDHPAGEGTTIALAALRLIARITQIIRDDLRREENGRLHIEKKLRQKIAEKMELHGQKMG